jgi:uncharacterized surface anchored protein
MTVVTAAAETEMGTVNIKFPSSAKGITMVAYEIGYYAEGEYIVNENFSGSDVSLEGIELADASEVQQISQTLMDYAENQGYEGKEVQVDVNGNVSVQLPATDKIYVMGQKDGKGIMQILSFLALLPYYTADGRQTVIDATSKISLSSNFEYNKGDVLLNKVDNSGKALQGAVFKFERKKYYIETYADEIPENAEKGTDDMGAYYWQTLSSELTTNEKGQIVVQDVDFGSYRFTEIKAPKGFVLKKDIIYFDIEEKGTVKLENGVYVRDEGEPVILTVVNEPEKATEPPTVPPTTPPTTPPPTQGTEQSGKTVFTMDTAKGSIAVIFGVAAIALALAFVSSKKKKSDV